jgi:hypothetical protein
MRSINYQLSNLKYLKEGWTVRAKSAIDLDEMNLDEVEFNLFAYNSSFSVVEKVINWERHSFFNE